MASNSSDGNTNDKNNEDVTNSNTLIIVESATNEILPTEKWDPLNSPDWDAAGDPASSALSIIDEDFKNIVKKPELGKFVSRVEGKNSVFQCLIFGPKDTSFDGGFFYFVVRFGPKYPEEEPRIRFMTTGGGTFTFHQSIDHDGKFDRDFFTNWTSPQDLKSSFLAILNMFVVHPAFIGISAKNDQEDYEHCTRFLTHETIRVSVCDQLEQVLLYNDAEFMTPELVTVMQDSFLENFKKYIEKCNANMKVDGQNMYLHETDGEGEFHFETLLNRLIRLENKISMKDDDSYYMDEMYFYSSSTDEEENSGDEEKVEDTECSKGEKANSNKDSEERDSCKEDKLGAYSCKEVSKESNSGQEVSKESNSGQEASKESNSGEDVSKESNSVQDLSKESNSGQDVSKVSNSGHEVSKESNSGHEVRKVSNSGHEVSKVSNSGHEVSKESNSGQEVSKESNSGQEIDKEINFNIEGTNCRKVGAEENSSKSEVGNFSKIENKKTNYRTESEEACSSKENEANPSKVREGGNLTKGEEAIAVKM